MNEIDKRMLQIKSLDPNASLKFSNYSYKWYVSARIEVGGDGVLVSINEHELTPENAVDSYFRSLISVDSDHYLVTNSCDIDTRREYRWNGAAFQEIGRTK
jgi:hypothetical protein